MGACNAPIRHGCSKNCRIHRQKPLNRGQHLLRCLYRIHVNARGRRHARRNGARSVAAIPIAYDDTLQGVLVLGSERPTAFDPDERAVVGQLGDIVVHALTAIERKRALTSEHVVELQLRVTDLFDAVVASYDVGAHKPESAPFDRLRERVAADEYVLVGDSEDVAGARAAGFVPIEYTTDGPDLWATVEALL